MYRSRSVLGGRLLSSRLDEIGWQSKVDEEADRFVEIVFTVPRGSRYLDEGGLDLQMCDRSSLAPPPSSAS
jgi:hypothetical protein